MATLTDDRERVDAELMPDAPTTALVARAPSTPVTLSDLAAMKGEAIEVVEARVQVITTLRRASIRATHPPDWLLFKAPDEQGGQIVGYLQDAGCDRVRDLWGIEVYGVSVPEKLVGADAGVFHYLVRGNGRCRLTKQSIEAIEGGRASTDDFVRGVTGLQLELLVRKAARANLDGNITRELAGMNSVPVEELGAAWVGTPKRVEDCRRGRGFGTAGERLGARNEKAPDVDPPTCPHCGTKGKYREGKNGRGAFFGCPQYQSHADKKWIVDAAEWVAKQSKAAPVSTSSAPAPATATPASGPPLTAGDVFGNKREPGQEG
jgi:hypothetical protein